MVLLKGFFIILNGVGMLKKYFYVSILLGAIALSGCADDEDGSKEVTEESSPAEQSKANNNEVNTIKTKEAAPIPLNLTQEQKEGYYRKYVDIIDKVNAENNDDLELEPITAFLDEYWIDVTDFEKLAIARANVSIVVLKNNEPYNPLAVPKTVKFKIGSKEANIIFEGSFETKYNPNVSGGGQLFSVFNGISSKAENPDESWTQIEYADYLSENESTYVIDVSGKYSQGGIISKHIVSLEFNCDETGGIS